MNWTGIESTSTRTIKKTLHISNKKLEKNVLLLAIMFQITHSSSKRNMWTQRKAM
jgi:hypothetical protein